VLCSSSRAWKGGSFTWLERWQAAACETQTPTLSLSAIPSLGEPDQSASWLA